MIRNQPPYRLFICIYSTGISYADRWVEEYGDYRALAFLPFRSLILRVDRVCPEDLKLQIVAHAATIQARRGEKFQVTSSGQTVLLGE